MVFGALFYWAVGFGCSAQEAFELAKAALLLERLPRTRRLSC